MLQTGLLYCQFPKEYLICPFGFAHFIPSRLLEKSGQPTQGLHWRTLGENSLFSCLGRGRGAAWKSISFSECFWKDLFVELLLAMWSCRKTPVSPIRRCPLKVGQGRGRRGGGLCRPRLPGSAPAVRSRVPWSGSAYNWCAVCIAESWTAPFRVQGKM